MYKGQLKPSFRSRIDPPLPCRNKKGKHLGRKQSCQRFSSFQTPPGSENQYEFSDYNNTPESKKNEEVKYVSAKKNEKKKKSYILVQEMPVQYDHSASAKKRRQASQNYQQVLESNKKQAQARLSQIEKELKENSGLKFNYLNTDKNLSTIKEDNREYMRESRNSAGVHPFSPSPAFVLPASQPVPIVPKYRYHEDILDAEVSFNERVEIEEKRLRYEEQRLRLALVEQQNISLKEVVLRLEQQLKRKDEEKARRQSQIAVQKQSRIALEEEANITRKQTKQKMLDEIASLQLRCKQMKEQFIAYKIKQQQKFNRLFMDRQNVMERQYTSERSEIGSRRQSEPHPNITVIESHKTNEAKQKLLNEISVIQKRCKDMQEEMYIYKTKQERRFNQLLQEREEEKSQFQEKSKKAEYYSKFIEVFLSMLYKIEVEIDPKWSDKKKIAIGWKVVKLLVKKALKLGLQIPKIVDSQDIQLQK